VLTIFGIGNNVYFYNEMRNLVEYIKNMIYNEKNTVGLLLLLKMNNNYLLIKIVENL